jgi:hypothetical protein
VGLLREGVGEVYLPAATYVLDLTVHLRKRGDVFSRLRACTRIRRPCREGDGFFPTSFGARWGTRRWDGIASRVDSVPFASYQPIVKMWKILLLLNKRVYCCYIGVLNSPSS